MTSSRIPAAGTSPPLTLVVGFAGKRRLPLGDALLRETLRALLHDLALGFPPPHDQIVGLSALAFGADTVFAEVCAARGCRLRVVLPAPPDTFFNLADFDELPALLARSRAALTHPNVLDVRVVSAAATAEARFAETGRRIADDCHLLLVACTRAEADAALAEAEPSPPFLPGGSAETLRYAHRRGRRLTVILVDELAEEFGMLEHFAWPPDPTLTV